MKYLVQISRDSDNSDPTEVEIEVINGEYLSLKLTGPERKIWLNIEELRDIIGIEDGR